MSLVRISPDCTINAAYIMSMEWNRRSYANYAGTSVLSITMSDGAVHRVRHEPHLLGGSDAYDVERRLIEAANAPGQ